MTSSAQNGPGEDRLLTVPNLLSLGRLCCIPLFLWLLFGRDNELGAAVLLGVLGLTDWVDGYVARRFDQVSNAGKVLDPVADRVLLGVAVVSILLKGAVPAWVAWLTIVREGGIAVAFLVLAALGARRIDVQWVGKAGAFLLMVAFPLFLAGHDRQWALHGPARALAWALVLPGLALTWYSAITYVPLGRRALREGRVGSN